MIFEEDINNACRAMRDGGVILYPTDTIWGIGCDATNCDAVKRVYEIKQRIDSKALIVMVNSINMASNYVEDINKEALDILNSSVKPTTIIYQNAKGLSPNLIASDGSIAIRVTNEAFSKRLCESFGKGVVSTSANISGESAAKNYAEISNTIKEAVDYIVKYRQDDVSENSASSIVKVETSGEIIVIRA